MVTKEKPPVKKEGNELIAKFMGFTKRDNVWLDFEDGHSWRTEFQYDSSWCELMEVVERIEKLTEFKFSITTWYSDFAWFTDLKNKDGKLNHVIVGSWGSESLEKIKCNSKIEATWRVCVEFIKWYNEQKKKK